MSYQLYVFINETGNGFKRYESSSVSIPDYI